MTTTTRTYTKRDSATAVLKKAGVLAAAYNGFIVKTAAGTFEIYQNEAGQFVRQDEVAPAAEETNGVASIVAQALARNAANTERLKSQTKTSVVHSTEDEDEVKPVKKAKAAKSDKKAAKAERAAKAVKNVGADDTGKPVTVSSFMRGMILDGATNQEVWEAAQPLFGLDDKKRGYPAWYRTELKNKGLLAK